VGSGRSIGWIIRSRHHRLAILAAVLFTLGACDDSPTSPPHSADSLPPPVAMVAVSAGYYATCGLGPSGQAYCWGTGREGQLGASAPEDCSEIPGEFPCASSPLELGELLTYVGAGGQHACGIHQSGYVVCWGDGSHGELGRQPPISACSPTSSGCARLPVIVPLERQAATLSVGGSHNCVLDDTGVAICWGYNQAGRLGTGDQTTRFSPTPVATDLRFIAVAAGGTHTCAIAEDGRGILLGL
jgi:alpha-tubulin suppressor-like RCC1 family protein